MAKEKKKTIMDRIRDIDPKFKAGKKRIEAMEDAIETQERYLRKRKK